MPIILGGRGILKILLIMNIVINVLTSSYVVKIFQQSGHYKPL
jgi:hypothetical protein